MLLLPGRSFGLKNDKNITIAGEVNLKLTEQLTKLQQSICTAFVRHTNMSLKKKLVG